MTAGNGAIIHWQRFSVGPGELARFVQPSAQSAVLNRVTGAEASQLLGQLQGNGHVFLINPNGIVVGSGARIDTNSFVASTLDIADADFLAGRMRFLAGANAGGIRNDGVITAGPGGKVALISPDIVNSGIIHAPDGQILLAAGRSIEITSTDLSGVRFEVQAPTDSVLNLGRLLAENGAVRAFAANLRNSGEVRADRMVQGADGSVSLVASGELTLGADSLVSASGIAGGQVRLQSQAGTTRVGGSVLATGSTGQGGSIQVLGERVALEASAQVDASGGAGGGQLLVGGDFQGANAQVQNASRVSVAEGAALRADATQRGDGGRVIVWADENTRFGGAISARGGPEGGNGGFAEVSGKQNLQFTGSADLRAPRGALGTLLLDPLDIVVAIGSGILPSVTDEFADFADNVVTIDPGKLDAIGANVMLQANRHIFVKDRISLATAGAGVTLLAGGATAANGSIHLEDLGSVRPGGIATNGGAVVLRGHGVTGAGTISTAGGAVDIQTVGTLAYTSAIDSGGGAVTLASQTGSVTGADVSAAGGTIGVTGATGISGGRYAGTGRIGLQATDGGISVGELSGGSIDLQASGSIDATVVATDRVDAQSTGSYISLDNLGGAQLRLGTLRAATGINLFTTAGLAQASGGALHTDDLNVWTNGSTAGAGSADAPLQVVSGTPTQVSFSGLAAPVHLRFGSDTVVAGVSLAGTVGALGASSLGGSANLGAWSFGSSGPSLQFSGSATSGFSGLLSLQVSGGGLEVASLDLQGGGSAYLQAQGAVALGNVTTTRSTGYGLDVLAQQCSSGQACSAQSPITVGAIQAGTGRVRLRTRDNGDIQVGSVTAGGLEVEAGQLYSVYNGYYPAYYLGYPTTNNVVLDAVNATGAVTVTLGGHGNLGIGSLSATGSVNVLAGAYGSYYVPDGSGGYTTERTLNQVSIHNAEPSGASGSYQVENQGIGDLTLTGGVSRSFGSIDLTATTGNLTAGNLATGSQVQVNAVNGTVSLQDVSAASSIGVQSGGDLAFGRLTSSGSSITLSSATGSVETRLDDAEADVSAAGNVTITAADSFNGFIGDSALGNPLDIRAGATSTISLTAGRDIGTLGHALRVDTGGTVRASTQAGQFQLEATDLATGSLRNVATVELTASAAGVGNGQTANFSSQNLNVSASSDGTDLTLGDLAQSAGTLNALRFTAKGGGLKFGDVVFSGLGYRALSLSSDAGITQLAGNISAGHTELNAQGAVLANDVSIVSNTVMDGFVVNATGDIKTGNLSARSVDLDGANLSLGSVTSTGTARGYPSYQCSWRVCGYLTEELVLNASGNLKTSGGITSATSARLSAGGDIVIGVDGLGSAAAGTTITSYYTDTLRLQAQGQLRTSALSGRWVDLGAADAQVGDITAQSQVVFAGGATGDLVAGRITGSTVQLSGDQLTTGSIDASSSISLDAANLVTDALATNGSLAITVDGAYAPAATLNAAYASITAGGDITISPDNVLTANQVVLTTTAGSGGNIAAELRETRRLTVNADQGFDVDVVNASALMTDLTVNAQWDRATGGPSNGASVSAITLLETTQDFLLTDRSLSVGSSGPTASWNVRYDDSAANAMAQSLSVGLNHLQGGSFGINMASQTALDVGATLGVNTTAASLTLETGGTIALNGVSTRGGSVAATSRGGDILVGSVSTSGAVGGDVTLTSLAGNILLGIEAQGLDTATEVVGTVLTLNPGGKVTLDARQGSIGAEQGPALAMSHVRGLTLRARDTVNVSVGAGALSMLDLETSVAGSGSVLVDSALNFGVSGLGLGREAASNALALYGLSSTGLTDLRLAATDGGVAVAGNVSGVGNLSLDAMGGDLSIAPVEGALSVAATGTLDLRATGDIRIASGAAATDSVSVSAAVLRMNAGQDLRVQADGAAVTVTGTGTVYSQTLSAGRDWVLQGGAGAGASAVISLAAPTYQYLQAGRDFSIRGGTGSNAHAALDVTGAMSEQRLTADGNVTLEGGAGDGSYARINEAVTWQYLDIDGSLAVKGGSGTGSYASWALAATHSGAQSGSIGGDLIVQGGNAVNQGTGAYAVFAGGTSQSINTIGGAIRVTGGTAAGNHAELTSRGSQNLGSANSYYGVTDAILVEGGSGDAAHALLTAGGNQTLYAGADGTSSGDIEVLGGSGLEARAEIGSGGYQTLGSTSTSCSDYGCNRPTQDIRVQGGSGDTASATIRGTTGQVLNAGGTVSVKGGSATGAVAAITATNANASQTIGSNSTFRNDTTDRIEVHGGSAAAASITAGGNQTLHSAGDIVAAGGTGAGASAVIASLNASQTIGSVSISGRNATDSILLQGGTGTGAFAAIRAATGQTLQAGGTISLAGGAAGSYAEITSSAGAQQVGSANIDSDYSYDWYNDATDSISLAGGATGAWARIGGGDQLIAANTSIALLGGTGAGSSAQMAASGGQSVHSLGSLAITGGTDSGTGADATGLINTTSGEQSVVVGGKLSITGGAGASDTGILQQSLESLQSVVAGGSIGLSAPTASSGRVSIDSSGAQDIRAGGSLSIANQAGADVRLNASGGAQSIQARALAIELGGTQAGAFAGITTTNGNDQAIRLLGDGTTQGSATVTLRNTSSGTGARAAIASSGALDLQATDDNYDSAGLVQVGHVNDTGASEISAATDLNLVAGSLLIQGGATATATAAINAQDHMTVSTLYGATELTGGAAGSASIDPTLLEVVSSGSVLLQGGSNASATSTITAGTFNLASTGGDLSLQNGGASATIKATTFNYIGPGAVNLNGGTITVTDAGTIDVLGQCFNCATNLFGPFFVRSYVPPLAPEPGASPLPGATPLWYYINQATGGLLTLTDSFGGTFEVLMLEDGTIVMKRTLVNQCS